MGKGIWEAMGAVAGLLAVAVAIFVFVQGRSEQSKKIEVQLVARSTLVDTAMSSAAKGIEILYSGRKVPNYAILQFRVANVGAQPIRSGDYEVPVEIEVQDASEILSVEQSSSDPQGLDAKPTIAGTKIQMAPVLMNPTDSFTIIAGIVPVQGATQNIITRGRIAGIKKIDFREALPPPGPGPVPRRWFEVLLLTQSAVMLVMLGVSWFLRRRQLL